MALNGFGTILGSSWVTSKTRKRHRAAWMNLYGDLTWDNPFLAEEAILDDWIFLPGPRSVGTITQPQAGRRQTGRRYGTFVRLTHYALTVVPGSYTVTGTAAAVTVGRLVVATSATYTVTGTTALLTVSRRIVANPGTYALTGTAASLLRGVRLTATTSHYAITGTDAVLAHYKKLTQPRAGRLQTGQRYHDFTRAAASYVLAANPGTYTVTGSAVTFSITPRPIGETTQPLGGEGLVGRRYGNFTRTVQYTLTGDGGGYVVTGTAAALRRGYRVTASAGSYAWTGTAALFVRPYVLTATPGGYLIAGTAAGLAYSGASYGSSNLYVPLLRRRRR